MAFQDLVQRLPNSTYLDLVDQPGPDAEEFESPLTTFQHLGSDGETLPGGSSSSHARPDGPRPAQPLLIPASTETEEASVPEQPPVPTVVPEQPPTPGTGSTPPHPEPAPRLPTQLLPTTSYDSTTTSTRSGRHGHGGSEDSPDGRFRRRSDHTSSATTTPTKDWTTRSRNNDRRCFRNAWWERRRKRRFLLRRSSSEIIA